MSARDKVLEPSGVLEKCGLRYFLGVDEQLVVELFTETQMFNGPAVKCLNPCSVKKAYKIKATSLSASEYVIIRNTVSGKERVEKGPKLLFLEPHDVEGEVQQGTSVSNTEFVTVLNKLTGELSNQRGPLVWFPSSPEFAIKGAIRKATALQENQYVRITNTLTGHQRLERGPTLYFPDAYENVESPKHGLTLNNMQYVIVEDSLAGERSLIKGPRVWFPAGANEDVRGGVQDATSLQEDEYVRIKDTSTGERMVRRGKGIVFLEPTWTLETKVRPTLDARQGQQPSPVTKAWNLQAFQYLRLRNVTTGEITTHKGPQVVFPEADQELKGDILNAIELKVNEFTKVTDKQTGDIRSVRGAARVFLSPTEVDSGVQTAVNVDETTAALVRDDSTGQLRLVTEKQLFVPGPNETIVEERQLIKLASHEAVIVKDSDGTMGVHYGNREKETKERPRAFFLPPHSEIVTLNWSSGMRRLKRDLKIQFFDLRPGYMWFEFECRTSDNVELTLETTFFWEVVDMMKMVSRTGNLPGDIYNQIRSQFIKHVAKATLKDVMRDLHLICAAVFQDDKKFYDERGCDPQSLEVTRYACKDARTSEVLQQIIEETTNRLNRLSKAESENEVNLFRIQGQLEHEKVNGALLEIKQQHLQGEARATGGAEAERVSAFMQGLEKMVPKLEDRMTVWQTLRKTDALTVVSQGGGQLYYTPQDVNLSIRSDTAQKA